MLLLLTVFLVTLCTGCVIIITQRWHGRYSLDSAHGVQKHHKHPTPRIGGVAIACGLLAAWAGTAPAVSNLLAAVLLAGIPAFVFGLAEDITKKIGVLARLLATMLSGVLAWLLTGIAMQNTGFYPLDAVLQYTPLAVAFTAFAVGGVANSINIIDGFNGLASGSVAIMLSAMAWISWCLGDADLAMACLLMAACAVGFCAVNWPLGKLFLGDGGAYLLGFLLAWIAILLPMRNPQVSAWTTMLVVAYPVLEVVFSVLRRSRREGHHPGQPDKVHLHHLIHRRIICQKFPHLSGRLKNGLASPICWFCAALPASWAVVFAQNIPMVVLGLLAATLGYAMLYSKLAYFKWNPW